MRKLVWLTALFAFFFLLIGAVGTAQAEIIPPYGEGQIGFQAVVLCDTLTLRENPSTSAKAVKTLRYGERIIVAENDYLKEQSNGWAYCVLGDSEDAVTGWVVPDYIFIDPAWYRTEKSTPVYAWNDTAAPKVALLDENTLLPILKRDGAWLVVSLRGAAGWIYAGNERQNGERFETVIWLEGMEETVRYEHAVNSTIGFGMDYEYDILERRSESDHECFVSRYDDPNHPVNYLEVEYSPLSANAAAASVSETLSKEYDILMDSFLLDGTGSCIEIGASKAPNGQDSSDLLQTVYIIPAADGSVIASAHYTIESAEGFGTRFRNMMQTLVVIDRQR